MLPPKHVYNAVLRNGTNAVMECEATYACGDMAEEKVRTVSIEPNAQGVLEEITFEHGTMTMIYEIKSVKCTESGTDNVVQLDAPFDSVASPVRNYVFDISKGTTISLKGSLPEDK
mmetsp:Transcript_11337/g.18475  ORF Transcript_11337/g.18475 Transcript_11337/m.18475 type:complete len:116 (-) Transcript_11337:158-505(-)